MKKKLLFSAPHNFISKSLLAELERQFDVLYQYKANKDDVLKTLADVSVWIVSTAPAEYIGSNYIENAPKLEVVVTPSTGWTHIDRTFIEAKGITFYSLRGNSGLKDISASAEFTFLLVLSLARKLPLSLSQPKMGSWREKESELRGFELNGKVMGIIGFGRIGSYLAKYCQAFNMEVLATDIEERNMPGYVKKCSVDELLENSDFVALCITNLPTNKNYFNKAKFDRMKKGSYFINTSRGEMVSESALLESLKRGRIAGAAIDVLKGEQSIDFENNELMKYSAKHSNLIISPHVAGLTFDSERKAAEISIKRLLSHFRN